MGKNESTVELLVKVWEGIRELLEVPNKSTGPFFRHMGVQSLCYYDVDHTYNTLLLRETFYDMY